MKTLALLRHAKSSWDEPALSDFDRPLNARGRRAAKAVGRELKPRLVFDAVLASPALRVRQTLERLSEGFGPLPRIRFGQELYLASSAALQRSLRLLDDELRCILLVGHNPGLHQLVLELARPDDELRPELLENLPTGAAAILHAPIDRWRELEPGTAEIADLILPKNLKP